MKHQQFITLNLRAYLTGLICALASCFTVANAAGVNGPVDLATSPLASSASVPIQSNLLFIFDDSGSMALQYMPDTSNSSDIRLAQNAAYNTIYYNPSVTYLPPANFTSGGFDSATYPSQTGQATASGANSTTKPNWKAVKNDAFGVVAGGTADITNTAVYATTLPGNSTIPAEYCTKADLKNCAAQAGPSATRPFFAPIRWCNTTANALAANPAINACQATNMTGFTNLRTANARLAVITFNGGGTNRIVNSLKVSGAEIMFSATSTNTTNTTTIANEVADRINQCANNAAGNCTAAGYAASTSGATVYIFAPANSTTTATPAVTQTGGSAGQAVAAFALAGNPTIAGTNNAPGQVVYSVIKTRAAPALAPTFKFPGTNAKAPTRSDCLGTTCTYTEEMTNYANWYTYYRTRAQMMKTATSLAFKDVGDNFRVGFMATSTQAARSLNIARFDNAHKTLWYSRLFDTPSDRNTPLRGALSKAGRIFANKTTAGGVFTDPMQYECQKNFSLLTTDGFWNTADETNTYAGTPLNVEGTATVGDRDASPTPLGMRQGTPAVSDTLADVAKYYRDTDLRTPALNNCGAGVCSTPSASTPPPNEKQVMVTFTMGLGADGTLAYVPNYASVAGDYADIKAGTKNWPNPIANSGPERIDDLWHAAVNGGGTYFSAKNPTDVVAQLKEALALINVVSGAGSAAAASTLNPVADDNFAYVGSYISGIWTGNLERRTINISTGAISKAATHCVEDVAPTDSCASPSTLVPTGAGGFYCKQPAIPDAAACLDEFGVIVAGCKEVAANCNGTLKNKVGDFTSTARTIYTNVGGTLQNFTYGNLSGAQKAYLDTPWLASNLTQWPTLTSEQRANATGPNLVGYLRGERGFTFAATASANKVFRSRSAVLGDLVGSQPVFVSKPPFDYSDPGYQDFKALRATRGKTVFVGANDGMLHAFDANNLEERWAYVPSMVIPNMWKLADSNYSAKHSFYVDGDIAVADVCGAPPCSASTWKTILVGGLNAGGRGYYALDVTDPAAPQLLWEFNANSVGGDVNLGYSYGNPIVTKRSSDDKWVVIFSSGYNNIPDNSAFYGLTSTNFRPNNPAMFTGGNGGGYLYVLDAVTGAKIATPIATNEGTTGIPSGLGDIRALRPESQKNDSTRYIYGGDLLGYVWRFDLETNTAFKFAQLQAGAAQPITAAPELGSVKGKTVVMVGTGKYLEVSDITNNDQQTLYAIKDDAATVTLVNPRGSLVKQTIVASGSDTRESGPPNPIAEPLVTANGWYVDFPDPRERQNVASQLVFGTLLVPTIVPESSACKPAGYGWFNYLDYKTGLAVRGDTASPNNEVSSRTSAPIVGFTTFSITAPPPPDSPLGTPGTPIGITPQATLSDGTITTENPKVDIKGDSFQTRRSIWREIEVQ